jgi:hypothetical protein
MKDSQAVRPDATALFEQDLLEMAELVSKLHPQWLTVYNPPSGTFWIKQKGSMSLHTLIDSVSTHFDS